MTEAQGDPRDVFILGAGFSHAFHPKMPLLMSGDGENLKDLVMRKMACERYLKDFPIGDQDFEAWLSDLAAHHPWEDCPRKLLKESLALKVQDAIASVIDQRTAECTIGSDREQGWLCRMVKAWGNPELSKQRRMQ
jgi:hypothetical protein